jgi:FkbM family methyltransferase
MATDFNKPVHILHIGANWGQETPEYINKYRETLQSITYIECIPSIARGLKRKMETVTAYEKIPIYVVEALVSDTPGEVCTFHLSSDIFASSSMLEPNLENWPWKHVEFYDTIELTTTTCDELVSKGVLHTHYDCLVLDTQGAELKVLRGMESLFPSLQQILTEYSKKQLYKGAVLFDELTSYIEQMGFRLITQPSDEHGDIYFSR